MDWREQECAYRGRFPEAGGVANTLAEKDVVNSTCDVRQASAIYTLTRYFIGFCAGVALCSLFAISKVGEAYEHGRAERNQVHIVHEIHHYRT